MPERFGPWQTVYDPFRKWCRNGLWERILRRLPARKMHRGEMDWQLFAIDGTGVRAHQSAAGAKEKNGPSRNRRTTLEDEATAASARSST